MQDPDRNEQTTGAGSRVEGVRARTAGVLDRGAVGTLALVGGGALVVRALRANTRARGAIQAIAGLALLALGVRQRLSRDGAFDGGRPTRSDDDGSDSSGTATDTSTRTAHAVEHRSNPRDVTEEPDVATETDPDEGPVRFTTGEEDEPRPDPGADDGDEADDPRRREDDASEVDLSKTAMADEPNEAVGPQAEQAEPASTEATEPEPSPPEDASHVQADEPDTDAREATGDAPATDDDGADGTTADEDDAVSTDDRYEGERGDDGTVDDEGGVDRDEDAGA